ncbi:hypothetical protein ACHAXT_005284 [Thalassiosira profunda]
MAAASTAATVLYKYTYTLGRALYVPLTHKCNSIPLPQTRGPGFLLPRSVADALVNVRNAEAPGAVREDYYDGWAEDDRVGLPPYDAPLVNSLYEFGDGISEQLQRRREITTSGDGDVLDDKLRPSIATLVDEVTSRLDESSDAFDQVVIAGEGEPTLRMDALLAVARSVKPFRMQQDDTARKDQHPILPVRVITNGLCYGTPNLGYSQYNKDRDGSIVPMHRHVILRDMMEAGISRLSVALNTASRHEYDVLMEPTCYTGGGTIGSDESAATESNGESTLMPGTAHDIVCEFILEATKLGMDVEVTGIGRPEVDQTETNRLARMLLSVGPKYKKKKLVRWRPYFD